MNKVSFATTNKEKVLMAQTTCGDLGIKVMPVALDIDEIQGEDPEIIVRDKAKRAFEQIGSPVVVSDDSWSISALNGFPGPYMKSINYWFEPEDFLRLMQGIDDRDVKVIQYLAYIDGSRIKIFKNTFTGKILHKVSAAKNSIPISRVVELDADNGLSIAEVYALGTEGLAQRFKHRPDVWSKFAVWYKSLTN